MKASVAAPIEVGGSRTCPAPHISRYGTEITVRELTEAIVPRTSVGREDARNAQKGPERGGGRTRRVADFQPTAGVTVHLVLGYDIIGSRRHDDPPCTGLRQAKSLSGGTMESSISTPNSWNY